MRYKQKTFDKTSFLHKPITKTLEYLVFIKVFHRLKFKINGNDFIKKFTEKPNKQNPQQLK